MQWKKNTLRCEKAPGQKSRSVFSTSFRGIRKRPVEGWDKTKRRRSPAHTFCLNERTSEHQKSSSVPLAATINPLFTIVWRVHLILYARAVLLNRIIATLVKCKREIPRALYADARCGSFVLHKRWRFDLWPHKKHACSLLLRKANNTKKENKGYCYETKQRKMQPVCMFEFMGSRALLCWDTVKFGHTNPINCHNPGASCGI